MKTTMTRVAAAVAAVGTLLAALLALAGTANAATTPPAPPGHTLGVHVSNPHPHAGGTIAVSGRACTPGAGVTVFFDSQQLATGHVNPAGHYSIPVRIPGNAAAGHHTISVSVSGGSCPGPSVLGIEVLAPASANGGGSSLASTGVAVVGIGALGVVLLAGGAMMLLAGRRRTHA